jgi:hypothetical protein
MSKKMNNPTLDIEQSVMAKVRANEIIMKPKWYFVIGMVLTIVGLTASAIASIFVLNLSLFLLRSHGPMGQWRLQQILESFPVWLPILAIVGVATGIWLLKKFDFSYKRNFAIVIASFIGIVVLSAFILDYTGLSDIWFRQGPMRGFYRQNQNIDSIHPQNQNPRRGQSAGQNRN